jgi:hypothetical protein
MLLHQGFLVGVAREVLHGSPGLGGLGFKGLAKLLGASLRMTGEVLEEDAGGVERAGQSPRVAQSRQRPPEAKSVKAAEDP